MGWNADEPTQLEIRIVRSIVYTIALVIVFGMVWLVRVVEAN